MRETYDDNGRPCPKCGNPGLTPETMIWNAIRTYKAESITIHDIGWRCEVCKWEYGFSHSESSAHGETVVLKVYQ